MDTSLAVYLDYNATTPCDPEVIAAMVPYFDKVFGNPANGFHVSGRAASRAVEEARERIASLINAQAEEVVFTAGATESNNLAILGLARASSNGNRRRVVTSAIEHKAVSLPCKELQKEGFEIVVLPVDSDGVISVAAAREAIDNRTLLVSIQAANNEIGTIQPVREIADLAHQRGAAVHCDAAQAVGKIPVDVDKLAVDMLSMSAHKFYGPKGIGALFVRRGTTLPRLQPIMFGGGQERSLRPGTLNVPAIVGFGVAAQLSQRLLTLEAPRIQQLRDDLEGLVKTQIPNLVINGQRVRRLPNTTSLVFPQIEADALLFNMPELMMGTGSACTSGAVEPSHVLQALGLDRTAASATIRASLGRFTTADDICQAGEIMVRTWERMCSLNGTY